MIRPELKNKAISRRDLIHGALTLPAAGVLGGAWRKPTNLASVGWSWEGFGFTGGAGLSIFGLGEGAEYFGLNKVFNMWRSNDELAMGKLRQFEEVVCEISSTRPLRCGPNCQQSHYVGTPEALLKETQNLVRLSKNHPNITGAYIDDTLGPPERKPDAITEETLASTFQRLKQADPDLKLWSLVFSNQLYKQDFAAFKPYMDVINLWVWSAEGLSDLDRHIDRCGELFPDKPITLGCFLWDFPSMKYSRGNFVKGHAVPMDLLKLQWQLLLKYVVKGTISGYTILAAFLIDAAPEQARWVRDFIAAN